WHGSYRRGFLALFGRRDGGLGGNGPERFGGSAPGLPAPDSAGPGSAPGVAGDAGVAGDSGGAPPPSTADSAPAPPEPDWSGAPRSSVSGGSSVSSSCRRVKISRPADVCSVLVTITIASSPMRCAAESA